ncbi:helix-turn-helix transcriptional regulator [Bacillus cereus group sp. Bc015]|uniref:helix-turn-helix domain-containing protein n=1 Tax=Bacillus cereus group sp. Bc015 TaxID=3018123 RepID=UPI0022E764D7|nr:helix-turn-helix transcriptional regulator [Bacillus cereus group sp. Bc015]MDA2738424.1 helix-turn-helix transcriptional regulator [Bacillus cereus group sp. Bc015]
MIVKVNEKTNEQVKKNLERFPYFTIRCKLGEILKDRGITMQELSDLTGIRVATISELINMKRTTINVPHLIVIAMTLRITDMKDLLEFIMPPETEEIMKQDQQIIELYGSMLPEQDDYLSKIREQRKSPPTN